MHVNLPYEIGTVLKTVDNGIEKFDKVDHYIVGDKISVVLMLNYNTNPRLSIPIDVEEILKRWVKQ